jgi:hypothetical protein
VELLRYALLDAGLPREQRAGFMHVPDVPSDGPASGALLECLVCLFNALPDAAAYPSSMALGRLVPVPKKGCTPADKSTYRGICVSGVLGQLFDCILQTRLEAYVDTQQLRSPVQCGFRRGHGTLDAQFVMAHLINKHKHAKVPLYVCYVDFKKAFDLVRREEILARAEQLGVHGAFLRALRQWLVHSDLCVSVHGRQGEAFATHRGTKQGGRLSPLCFGLFVEQLHELIRMRVPGAGPYVGSMRVPDILYADDVKLLASNPDHLQQLLDVLDLFCTLFDMQVNVSPQKTCIVVYGPLGAAMREWHLGNMLVPVCDSYTDLGVLCTQQMGYAAGAEALAVAGRRAMHAALSMCRRGHLAQPAFKLRVFDAIVEPVLSYGCQVWGPWVWNLRDPLNVAAESVHIDFMRIMAGVGRRVKHQLLLHDFARYPIMYHWVALASRWWCSLMAPDQQDKLAARALRSDVWFMRAGCTDCWAFKFLDTLSELNVVDRHRWDSSVNPAVTVEQVLQITVCEKQVKRALRERFDGLLSSALSDMVQQRRRPSDPACRSDQVMLDTYLSYVRARDLHKLPLHLRCRRLSFAEVQTICRIRLGWHDLQVQKGRYSGQARDQRQCSVCRKRGHTNAAGRAPVEDLLHFLFDCPALQHVRDGFPQFFQPEYISRPEADVHARYVMNHKDQWQVAQALRALHAARTDVLSGPAAQQAQVGPASGGNNSKLARWAAWLRYQALPSDRRARLVDWY